MSRLHTGHRILELLMRVYPVALSCRELSRAIGVGEPTIRRHLRSSLADEVVITAGTRAIASQTSGKSLPGRPRTLYTIA